MTYLYRQIFLPESLRQEKLWGTMGLKALRVIETQSDAADFE